jgi:predicted kinase
MQDVANIHIHIGPPDTTGATQLLDQMNHSLHSEYRGERDELFTSEMSIAREGFKTILGNVWDKWATREKLVNAAKRVGISEDGLDVDWMQKDIFGTAARLMKVQDHIEETVNSPVTDWPKDV